MLERGAFVASGGHGGTPKGKLRYSISCSLCGGFQRKSPAFCLFAPLEGW